MTDIIQWGKHIARVSSYGAEAMAIQAPANSSSLSIFLPSPCLTHSSLLNFALFPEYLLFFHSPARGEIFTRDSCDSYSIYLVKNPFSPNFLIFLFWSQWPLLSLRYPEPLMISFSWPQSLESTSYLSLTSNSFLSTPSSNMTLFQNLSDRHKLGEISLPLLTFWCGLNCVLQTQVLKA